MADELSDRQDRDRLVDAGWRQGSLFKSSVELTPAYVGYDPEVEFLIIATQTCTLVSADFDKNPRVEVMVARPAAEYHGKSEKARGKNVRNFALPLKSGAIPAVECDLNRRFFVERRLLAAMNPLPDHGISDESRRDFAAWIARSYTRIELPDALVDRMRPLFKRIEKILKRGATPLHERIVHVYIQWSPDIELSSADSPYGVKLFFLCDDTEASEQLDRALIDLPREAEPGVSLAIRSQPKDETFIADLDAFVRLSEWDYLTNLGELGEHPLGL